MQDQPKPQADVIIAGAGPVGLFLACELQLGGASVLMLEQQPEPHAPLKRLPFGRRGLSAASLDAFDRRDLLNAVVAHAVEETRGSAAADAHWLRQPRVSDGHFAGIQFYRDQVDTEGWPHRLPHQPAASLSLSLDSIETIFTARAEALGVEIRRGIGVEGFTQDADGVSVRAGTETFRARWLIGCDGGRSVVRKASGFEFVGTEPEFTGYSALVSLADPDMIRPGRHYTPTGMYTFSPPGLFAVAAFDGGAFHRQAITHDHVQAVLRHFTGVALAVTDVQQAGTWTDRAHQTTAYRNGRILLAGDAAHIHSPLGGQGLNLGLGDAMNLGWKLAATVRGDAPAGLLDSYGPERHPVGAQVLDWSRAQVALMRPSPSSRALEAIVRDLIGTRDGATYFAERVLGVSARYDLGDDHPLVGRSAPDFELAAGSRVATLMRDGCGLLLDFDDRVSLKDLAGRSAGLVRYVAARAEVQLGLSALLVRPDGIVAWASDGHPDLAAATRAAASWFGMPS